MVIEQTVIFIGEGNGIFLYRFAMDIFTAKVIEIIKQIPPGKVLTYGCIARLAGNPRGARQVTRILHSMSDKYHLPWHRVINSRGQIAILDPLGSNEQRDRLEQEGVEVSPALIVDLQKFQWK